jgi:hypothetical protein
MDMTLLMGIAGATVFLVVVLYLLINAAFQAKRRDEEQARMLHKMTKHTTEAGMSDKAIRNITTLN